MNKIKLNALQSRTLALLQELAAAQGSQGEEATIEDMPVPHGDHMHIGRFAVSSRFASGLMNENVWKALERKGLARGDFPYRITLTKAGLAYKTGIGEDMLAESDH